MKIITKAQLLGMPQNTLFCNYDTLGNFGDLRLFMGPFGYVDFVCQNVMNVDLGKDVDWTTAMMEYEKEGSFKLDLDCCGRDGMYAEAQLYAVFEKEDVAQLIARLQQVLVACPT